MSYSLGSCVLYYTLLLERSEHVRWIVRVVNVFVNLKIYIVIEKRKKKRKNEQRSRYLPSSCCSSYFFVRTSASSCMLYKSPPKRVTRKKDGQREPKNGGLPFPFVFLCVLKYPIKCSRGPIGRLIIYFDFFLAREREKNAEEESLFRANHCWCVGRAMPCGRI